MLFYMRNWRILLKARRERGNLDAEWRSRYCPTGHEHQLYYVEDEHGVVLECGRNPKRCDYFSYVGQRR